MPYNDVFDVPVVNSWGASNPDMWTWKAKTPLPPVSFSVEGRYVPPEVKEFLIKKDILPSAIVEIDHAINWGLDYWVVTLKSGSVAWVRKAPLKIVHPTPASGCCEAKSVAESITIPLNVDLTMNGKPFDEEAARITAEVAAMDAHFNGSEEENINELSADNARDTVLFYQKIADLDGVDKETLLRNLLADLLHSADRNGLDFDGILADAARHYEDEVGLYGEVVNKFATTKLDTLQDEIEAVNERGSSAAAVFNESLADLEEIQSEINACQGELNDREAALTDAINVFNASVEREIQAIFARRGLYFTNAE